MTVEDLAPHFSLAEEYQYENLLNKGLFAQSYNSATY